VLVRSQATHRSGWDLWAHSFSLWRCRCAVCSSTLPPQVVQRGKRESPSRADSNHGCGCADMVLSRAAGRYGCDREPGTGFSRHSTKPRRFVEGSSKARRRPHFSSNSGSLDNLKPRNRCGAMPCAAQRAEPSNLLSPVWATSPSHCRLRHERRWCEPGSKLCRRPSARRSSNLRPRPVPSQTPANEAERRFEQANTRCKQD
jgi:hypothetical protein